MNDTIINSQDVAYFSVGGDLADFGFKGDYLAYSPRSTPVIVPYEWSLPDGTLAPVSLGEWPKSH
jgi:hypothetical protein